MSPQPITIRRCQHIKINGTQCGSPAVREQRFCYFHMGWRRQPDGRINAMESAPVRMPTLEDADSIQVALAEVMRSIVAKNVDHRTGSLLLRGLQIAARNLRHTSFEPEQPTMVVIDPLAVADRLLGAPAWSPTDPPDHGTPEPDNEKDNK